MKQMALATALVLALLTSVMASNAFYSSTSANPGGQLSQIAMPIEYVNYTIVDVDGVLWAQIDGVYPISLLASANCGLGSDLPMVYPMPPNATNIHVTVNGSELGWMPFPDLGSHQTAIGNWTLIYCSLSGVGDSFLLKIHYEHPIEQVNGSHIFLYDLNISPYLSPQSPNSVAHFAFRFQTGISDLHVYTAPPQSSQSQWQTKNYTKTWEGSTIVVLVDMRSQYGETLPGDLAVVFSDAQADGATLLPNTFKTRNSAENDLIWVIPVVLDIVLVAAVLFMKRKSVTSALSSRKSPNRNGA